MQPTMTEYNKWKEWEPTDKDLENLLRTGFLSRKASHHPLGKLKKNLLTNIFWAILITIGYGILLIKYPLWPVRIALVIMIGFNVFGIVSGWQLYKNIPENFSSGLNVLGMLRKCHSNIMEWGRQQMRLAVFVYPIAVTGGYILGGVSGSGKSLEQLLRSPIFVWALPISLLILVPLAMLLAKWLFRRAFGRHLETLQQMIIDLEKLD
ncbi:hypothetical protein KJS94_15600 [Flavihumibacter rivuli]|uniref:hypothetical protein n=1 Tax=Flavihumibacter rivuli TaxID=2838156 RepID=UPI001BDE1E03|nr:hypothetical protein [Flavihumibacter rivuli]ULQ56073.1 hypothetical protein KJS94_15600 [Flavihumibacter rivuli]